LDLWLTKPAPAKMGELREMSPRLTFAPATTRAAPARSGAVPGAEPGSVLRESLG